ncbi:peptide ABC transporter permease [Microbacterium nanhaiense]|uniref:Peptide ABC transporter permease n=1 Tax=Microbacterium nanhaiense TaxID=1301026 RepID=A0ABQ2N6A8_9MICO|nr:ABC transporter permease [Microbacterium nanhaiense]GGO67506.1 peptide ABC transporter permease [Microbacterium nanhaiense]
MTGLRFLGLRLAALIGLLFVLACTLFFLQEVSGRDPVASNIGGNASQEAIEAERSRLGLDRPLFVRLFAYLGGILTGDFGTSYRTGREVSADISTTFPATLELVLVAFAVALVLGALFAISSLLKWRGAGFFRGLLFVASTAPTFMLGIASLVIFYRLLQWLPASGRGGVTDGPTGMSILDSLLAVNFPAVGDAVMHIILPASALAVGPALAIGRVLRASLQETTRSDFVRTAQSKGLSEGAILRGHVFRNSLNATLSMGGLQLGFMFGGVLLIEGVFSWGGLGSYLGASLPVSDFPAIAGVTLILGALYIIANTVADTLQSIADPRIRIS